MRDIRPNKPNRRNRKKGFENSFEQSELELYESTKTLATGGRSQRPKRSVRGSRSPAKPRFTGSKVGVASITTPTAPRDTARVRSDMDHIVSKSAKGKLSRSPVRKKGTVQVRKRDRKFVVGFFGLVVVALVVAALLFLPTAAIELRLKTAPLLVDEKVVVRATGEVSEGVVPGVSFFREVVVDGSIPVETTEAVGSIATGTVEIVNATSEEQKIRERSRLETDGGQLFYMLTHAIVPPQSRREVQVEAAVAGEESNMTEGKLVFVALDPSSQDVLFAEVSGGGITGGSGEIISVVGESDIEVAQKAAEETARAQSEVEIETDLEEGWTILNESWTTEVLSFKPAAALGDRSPTLDYSARVSVRVMGYRQDVLEEFLQKALEMELDDEFMLFPGQISYTSSVQNVDWDKSEVTLAVRVTHSTIPELSIQTLREKLAGRSTDEAQQYLEGLPGVRSASLTTWPFWVQSMPRIESRISLDFESERQP